MNELATPHRIAGIILLLILCSSSLLGCTTVEATSSPVSAERPLTAEVICSSAGGTGEQCYVLARIGAFENDLRPTITAKVTGGIRFSDDSGQLTVSDEGRSSTSREFDIPFKETREVAMPFAADQNEILSGAYIILVQGSGVGVDGERYQAYAATFVKAEGGSARVLSSSSVLEAEIGEYIQGTGDLAYLVKIDPADSGRGELFVKLASREDNLQPELVVSVRDGIAFEQGAEYLVIESREVRWQLGTIHAAGYRIARLRFTIVPGSLGGQRAITAGYRQGDMVAGLELAPIYLWLHDSRLTGGAQITTGLMEPESLAGLAAGGQEEQSGGMRGGGISEPVVTPAPDRAVLAWDRVITGFHGNRWDAYQAYVAGQVDMDWESFRDNVLLFNPRLAQSGFVFQPDMTYVMPR